MIKNTRTVAAHDNLPLNASLITYVQGIDEHKHLDVVFAQKPDGTRICWLWNSQDGGYHTGVYGSGAWNSYIKRCEERCGL